MPSAAFSSGAAGHSRAGKKGSCFHPAMTIMIAHLLVAAVAAAQGAPLPSTTPIAPPRPVATRRHGGRTFISPMGEPFRSTSRDDDPLADWFSQADRNHDGRLTMDEMQLDADRFFALLDVNHDGEIDPDEISRYENVVAPEIQIGTELGYEPGITRDDGHQGAARFGLLDLPEPVVSADANFNRGVSLAEFRTAAAQRFVAIDVDHMGYLTLAGLELVRPAPAAKQEKRHPVETDDSPSPREH